jgi:hypothetical protein
MPEKRYCRLTDDEDIFLEENEISFSELVHWAIRKKKQERRKEIVMKKESNARVLLQDLVLVFLGIMFFGMTYITMPWIFFLCFNICALICMAGGLLLLVRDARRIAYEKMEEEQE